MNDHPRKFYTRDQVKQITGAYQHIFGSITPELRSYWDLDRNREWGCLTTDFQNATFEQYQEASRRTLEIEANLNRLAREHADQARMEAARKEAGRALRNVTQQTGVGLSLGVCPWTDHGLFETYERNQHKKRLTIILGHDWYPIVPNKQHPVDVPLSRGDGGLHRAVKYIQVEAVPKSIIEKSELLLFLNLKPDFRPPIARVTGAFNPYPRCVEGFSALVEAVSRNFKVQVISWGAPVWELLREKVDSTPVHLGVSENAKKQSGSLQELKCGKTSVPYLPLVHPCWAPNFKEARHFSHVLEGYRQMGLAD